MNDSDKSNKYDYLKTLFQGRINDRKYMEDKALTLIGTNGILIVISSGLFGTILSGDVTIPFYLLVSIIMLLVMYLGSAFCSLYVIYPQSIKNGNKGIVKKVYRYIKRRGKNNEESNRGEDEKKQESGIKSSIEELSDKLQEKIDEYENIILPFKAKWIKCSTIFFAFGLLLLVISFTLLIAIVIGLN